MSGGFAAVVQKHHFPIFIVFNNNNSVIYIVYRQDQSKVRKTFLIGCPTGCDQEIGERDVGFISTTSSIYLWKSGNPVSSLICARR